MAKRVKVEWLFQKAENTAKPADPDDIYATLDWETNPPINGFYETCLLYTSRCV